MARDLLLKPNLMDLRIGSFGNADFYERGDWISTVSENEINSKDDPDCVNGVVRSLHIEIAYAKVGISSQSAK